MIKLLLATIILLEPTSTPVPEPTPDTADKIIEYLEERRAEEERIKAEEEEKAKQEEEERLKAEEEEKAKLEEEQAKIQEEQAKIQADRLMMQQINATYGNQNTVIYGYANKYRYYLSYDEQIYVSGYTRINKYIYIFDDFTQFELSSSGNTLTFSNGDCMRVKADYNGNVTSTIITNKNINIGGLYNAYTNIREVDYPSLYQVPNTRENVFTAFTISGVLFMALHFGFSIIKFIIYGRSR